jgi:pyruvate-formate lyase-activating enzyme
MVTGRENVEIAQAHERAMAIANPQDHARSSWRRGRTRYVTGLRLRKLWFLAGRRHFLGRVVNFLVFLFERTRVAWVHYAAPVITVEAMNGCNLHCPECPTGMSSPSSRRKGRATLDNLKSVVDQVFRKSCQINFHFLGEPLLNEDFYAACAYAVEKGLWTTTHSNLNIRDEGLAQKLVASHLCNLVVSCDGATQAVYEKYRRGGDVELVFENVRAIAQHKRTLRSRFPWITAQFLVFEHNWHEMDLFRQRALAAGVDEILFLPGCRNGTAKSGHVGTEEVFDLSTLSWIPRQTPATCCELWETPIITYDGGLFPCCFCFRDEDLFVTPQEAGGRAIADHWNGRAYHAARSFFLGQSIPSADFPRPCHRCERTLARRNAQQLHTHSG